MAPIPKAKLRLPAEKAAAGSVAEIRRQCCLVNESDANDRELADLMEAAWRDLPE